MHIIYILLILFSISVNAIELDTNLLEKEIKNNPKNITTRLILVRSFMREEKFKDAQRLIGEVLKVDPKNQRAKFFLKDIKKLQHIKERINTTIKDKNKLNNYFIDLLKNRKYQDVISYYEVLKRDNVDTTNEIANSVIKSYINRKKYQKAKEVINSSSLSNSDKSIFLASICVKKHEYKKAEKFYKEVLEQEDNTQAASKLFDLLYQEGKSDEAVELVKYYKQNKPNSSITSMLVIKDKLMYKKRVKELGKRYAKKGDFKSLKEYFFGLSNIGQKSKGYQLLRNYLKKNSSDEEAILFLANNLYWDKKIDKSLQVLKKVVNRTKNRDILSLYANLLLQKKEDKKALIYLQKLDKFGVNGVNKKIKDIKARDYLATAVKAHRLKNYPLALKNYIDYYKITNDAKIAKEIAELYFIQKKPKRAIPFYKAYLKTNPNDSRIRFRYASALNAIKEYSKAEKEYLKVAAYHDKLFDLATYRYASMLTIQKDEAKWRKSRGVYRFLLNKLYNEPRTKQRDNLIKYTKLMVIKVNKPMPKPTRYKDIILAEGQHKKVSSSVFEKSKFLKRDIFGIKSIIKPTLNTVHDRKRDVKLDFHSLNDESLTDISYGIRFNNAVKVSKNTTVSFETKHYSFKKDGKRQNAKSFGAYFDYKNFGFGIGVDKFEDFDKIFAQLTYHQFINSHNITLGLKSTNGVFVNSNSCLIDNRIDVLQFSLYDAVLLSNLDQAEFGVTVNKYSDNNLYLNSWGEYPIYRGIYGKFENLFAVSGSYEFNTKTDTCYYSTDFFDGNYVLIKPKYNFSKNSYLQGTYGIGYSFQNQDILYNYGLTAVISLHKFFETRVDCRHYSSGSSPKGADECFASLAYIW